MNLNNLKFTNKQVRGTLLVLVFLVSFGAIALFLQQKSDKIDENDVLITENHPEKLQAKSIELNSASAEQLQKLKGIGEVLSKRIVKYREKVAWFHEKSDLKKVWGIKPETYEKIEQFVYVDQKLLETLPKKKKFSKKQQISIELPANLNEITRKELLSTKLFPPKLSHTIINYRKKIGGFKSIKQAQKSYGMNEKYRKILEENFFVETSEKSDKPEKKKKTKEKLNLNTANAEELDKLPMIGKVFSKRIVKYRNALGFFHSVEQLKEVYGLKTENYKAIKDLVFVSKSDFSAQKKLKINSASFKQILHHPYINYEQTKILANYRDKNRVKSFEDLLKIPEVDKKMLEKTKIYFRYD